MSQTADQNSPNPFEAHINTINTVHWWIFPYDTRLKYWFNTINTVHCWIFTYDPTAKYWFNTINTVHCRIFTYDTTVKYWFNTINTVHCWILDGWIIPGIQKCKCERVWINFSPARMDNLQLYSRICKSNLHKAVGDTFIPGYNSYIGLHTFLKWPNVSSVRFLGVILTMH